MALFWLPRLWSVHFVAPSWPASQLCKAVACIPDPTDRKQTCHGIYLDGMISYGGTRFNQGSVHRILRNKTPFKSIQLHLQESKLTPIQMQHIHMKSQQIGIDWGHPHAVLPTTSSARHLVLDMWGQAHIVMAIYWFHMHKWGMAKMDGL